MSRMRISVVAIAIFVVACSGSTAPTAAVEKTGETGFERIRCLAYENPERMFRTQIESRMKEIAYEVQSELVRVDVDYGTVYIPGQGHGTVENYYPTHFHPFIDCEHAVAVFTLTVRDNTDTQWRLALERWARAVYEVTTAVRNDDAFADLDQLGFRTFFKTDASILDGIMEMSDIRAMPERPYAEAYASLLEQNVWGVDIRRRVPSAP